MSKQRSKGTGFESSLLPLLQEYYPDAHRLGAQGAKDVGDFWLPEPRFVIEAKNYSTYAGKLAGWLGEAEREAANAEVPFGVCVFKRKGVTSPGKQFVLTDLRTFMELVANGT